MKYIGYMEIAVGFGQGLGPGIGGHLYPFYGYENTMYIFASLCLLSIILVFYLIPNELNETATEKEISELE